MELTAEQILNYINFEEVTHRTTLGRLRRTGKTFRSRDVTREYGYLNALRDIKDAIELPAKNKEMEQAVKKWGETLTM